MLDKYNFKLIEYGNGQCELRKYYTPSTNT